MFSARTGFATECKGGRCSRGSEFWAWTSALLLLKHKQSLESQPALIFIQVGKSGIKSDIETEVLTEERWADVCIAWLSL